MIKRLPFALALAVSFAPWCAASAQEIPAAAPTVSAEKSTETKTKTADEDWAEIQKLRDAVEQSQSKEEAEKRLRDCIAATDAFSKNHPADPRRWDAKLQSMVLKTGYANLTGAEVKSTALDAKELEAIQSAPDASADAKGEAVYITLMSKTIMDIDPAKPETILASHKEISAFLAKNEANPHAAEVAMMQLQLLRMAESPDADAILKGLSDSKNAEVAEQAKYTIAQRELIAKLKKTPLDLKYVSTDGAEIDLAKLRGKVVLVDFWASWCPPCVAEAPDVVKIYAGLHDKGFDILGVSLDDDKDAMEAAQKKAGMTWPQYFDGGGMENKVSKPFNVRIIPEMWLIDKKGMLRDTTARSSSLAEKVTKLLAE